METIVLSFFENSIINIIFAENIKLLEVKTEDQISETLVVFFALLIMNWRQEYFVIWN